jgi:DNA (cytosine-5)-methyltransferase 1
MKVLNLYSGIGGNRKLWKNVKVTAVENNPAIAAIYQDFFPGDEMIIGDAHEYLLKHYKEFGFIWSSPPCQTHSKTMFWNHIKKRYPNMALYEEIIFLKHFFYGIWVVENVKPYYEPLIPPQFVDRHVFWANFQISAINIGEVVRNDRGNGIKVKMQKRGFDIKDWRGYEGDKRPVLNNCVYPELGLHVFNCAMKIKPEPIGLFSGIAANE